jgi:hypothetical protein
MTIVLDPYPVGPGNVLPGRTWIRNNCNGSGSELFDTIVCIINYNFCKYFFKTVQFVLDYIYISLENL